MTASPRKLVCTSSLLFCVNHQPSSLFVLPLVFLTIFISPENAPNNFCYPQMMPVDYMSLFPDERICKVTLFQYKFIGCTTVSIYQVEN